MRDNIGNTISPGDLLLWQPHNLIFRVVRVREPQMVSNSPESPSLELELVIPMPPVDKGVEAQVPSMYVVTNPQAQAKLEALVDTATKARKQ